MPLVFMYGPDCLQGRMFDRVGPTEVRGSAILAGHRLAFDKPNMKNKAEGLPNLGEADDGEVFGVVFELADKQVEILDGFFGGYEQRRLRPQVLPKPTEGEENAPGEPTPVGALTWIARRVGRGLKASHANFEATLAGLEENEAPERFINELKEFEALPSETIELMVQFERGFDENDARTLMGAAGGTIRRRMRTDHEDQVMLLVKIPRDRAEVVEGDLGKHPKVTLVERNADGFGIV